MPGKRTMKAGRRKRLKSRSRKGGMAALINQAIVPFGLTYLATRKKRRGGSRKRRGGSRKRRGGSRKRRGGSRKRRGGGGCGVADHTGGRKRRRKRKRSRGRRRRGGDPGDE